MTSTSASAKVDPKLAIQFFQLLKEDYEGGALSDKAQALIQEEPNLLVCKFPDEIPEEVDLEEWSGLTAAECMCNYDAIGPGGRDTLLELVEAGAMATDACYDSVHEDEVTNIDYVEVLLLSGYMPLKTRNYYFLDWMVDSCHDEPSITMGTIMKILNRRVQAGDTFSGGEIDARLVKNIDDRLPTLEPGVTHKNDGPFAKYEKEWLTKNDTASDYDNNRSSREEGKDDKNDAEVESENETNPKKKQRFG